MLNDLIVADGVDKEYLQKVYTFIDEWNSSVDHIKVSTSGSTGTPKIVELKKDRVAASARSTGRFFAFEKGETALLCLSPDYIAGKLMIVRAIEHEMNLMVAPLSSNPLIDMNVQPIDFAAFVPSQVETIISNDRSKKVFDQIKNVIIGGAPINAKTENELTLFSPRIFASFGMTETITHFALRKLGTPIYKCLDGFQISSDNNDCLVVHPNDVVDEILFTNDVISTIDESSFKWLGRIDNVINSGGVKIHPEKAEKMIAHLIPNNRFYMTSKKNDQFGEIAVLVVEGELANQQILEDAKTSLPKHHAPKELITEDSFEETPTQKVIRKKF